MESNYKFKKIDIKNCISITIKIEDFDFDTILIDKKSHENALVYNMSYNILIGVKPMRIKFDKVNGFIRFYDGTR